MTEQKLIERDSRGQLESDADRYAAESGVQRVAACLACVALERDRTGDARTLHRLASRCVCGCVSPETLAELAAIAMVDALTALAEHALSGA